MRWHRLPLTCDLGHKAQILEVEVVATGVIQLEGVCIFCGKPIEKSYTMSACIALSALLDKEDETKEDPGTAILRNFRTDVVN